MEKAIKLYGASAFLVGVLAVCSGCAGSGGPEGYVKLS